MAKLDHLLNIVYNYVINDDFEAAIRLLKEKIDPSVEMYHELVEAESTVSSLTRLKKNGAIDDLIEEQRAIGLWILSLVRNISETDLRPPLKTTEKIVSSEHLITSVIDHSPNSLEIKVNPGTAPPEEIARYLAKLSRLYKLTGGSGLTFMPIDVDVKEGEEVHHG